MQFCQRQQQRLHTEGHADAALAAEPAMPSATPAAAAAAASASASSSGVSPPPRFSPATVSWLRMLCLDMLSTLQAACPGFMRTFMNMRHLHAGVLAEKPPEQFITMTRGKKKNKKNKVRQKSSKSKQHAHTMALDSNSHSCLLFFLSFLSSRLIRMSNVNAKKPSMLFMRT